MTLLEAITARHSVRSFTSQVIEPDKVEALTHVIKQCNEESGMHIQLVTDEPRAFGNVLTHYGAFRGVTDYIALVGPDDKLLSENAGYYGERIVLEAQCLGLNTCWVALTYSKSRSRVVVGVGEKLSCVIALGYGTTQGHAHHIKSFEQVARVTGAVPEWFRHGVEAALLAPTAVNQQQFRFTLVDENKVKAEARFGFFSKVDLGIVKLHFEIGAGKSNFTWI